MRVRAAATATGGGGAASGSGSSVSAWYWAPMRGARGGMRCVVGGAAGGVRFLGLALGEAGEALQGYDVETLPTLVVYQHGEVVETLFRVGSDLAPSYDAADVESLLDTVPAFAGDGPVAPPPPARTGSDARKGPPPPVEGC